MAGKHVKVTKESDTGMNRQFVDTKTGETMTRAQFVRQINQGNYPSYHVRNIDGVKVPASNPDKSEGNNLG